MEFCILEPFPYRGGGVYRAKSIAQPCIIASGDKLFTQCTLFVFDVFQNAFKASVFFQQLQRGLFANALYAGQII